MKQFDYKKYLDKNPLLKEEQYATFKNNKVYISRPKQSAPPIKGDKDGTIELIYTLQKLQSIYKISKEDMEIIYKLINNVLK